jgi:hypothetical protein
MVVDMVDLKLSTARGLLGHVFPTLRAVCVNSTENLIRVCFYCNGEITEDHTELCESVLDDVTSDFLHLIKEGEGGLEFETPIIRLDYPNKMPLVGEWVYYRCEDSDPTFSSLSSQAVIK